MAGIITLAVCILGVLISPYVSTTKKTSATWIIG